MQNLEAIEAATAALTAQGVNVLNSFLLADTEEAHAQRLLELMRPPLDAVVVDAGCGTGALARLMREHRQDLQFFLVNVSEGQLAQAPCSPGFERVLASYDAIPIPDACADVVMFAFSLCHSNNWLTTLGEAARVLKPGGILFIFDMVRGHGGSNALMQDLLQAHAYRSPLVGSMVERSGFVMDPADVLGHVPSVYRLREAFDAKPVYDHVFDGIVPFTIRAQLSVVQDPVESAFRRHRKIGFQFSGGRDSLAALLQLRDRWEHMTVYHVDSGDQFPETRAVVDAIDAMLPRPMVRIVSDVKASRAGHGFPSDVVPVDNTELGRLVSGRTIKIVSRYECCARNLMQPLHQRMLEDGVTLVIRGQRDEDYASAPMRSGQVSPEGLEVLYPIQSWTTAQVDQYLGEQGAPVPPFYAEGMSHGSDCMGCTAWGSDGRLPYMKKHHPEVHQRVIVRIRAIHAEVTRQQAQLEI